MERRAGAIAGLFDGSHGFVWPEVQVHGSLMFVLTCVCIITSNACEYNDLKITFRKYVQRDGLLTSSCLFRGELSGTICYQSLGSYSGRRVTSLTLRRHITGFSRPSFSASPFLFPKCILNQGTSYVGTPLASFRQGCCSTTLRPG